MTDDHKRLNETIIQKVFGYTFAPAEEWSLEKQDRRCDRWIPPNPQQQCFYGACSSKDQSGLKDPTLPDFKLDWNAMKLVIDRMAELDWRLTLTAPGGFTDEGLGGGDPKTKKWVAVFKRPDPEANGAVGGIADDKTGYAKAGTAPEAVALAALNAMGPE